MSSDAQFSDFTRDNYRRLIELAKQRFIFRDFTDFSRDEAFVLWRHDLDFSVHAALKLARIEAEQNVLATYFLYMHSSFYNLFEPAVSQGVREIAALGHSIGLHFDHHCYDIKDESAVEQYLIREKSVLEEMLGVTISVFSFHNTDRFTESCRQWSYAGMINAYAEFFRTAVRYVSDSNGYWRFQRLEDVLLDEETSALQVLTHPAWWQDSPMPPRARVERCIRGRAEATGQTYDQALAEAGRLNVRE